ncbi:MAG TPA: ABC transporter permease [Candidatus Angelobacter sp.]|nr:ABC transporter permease [Candidatus Angelobacter sp.]
MYLIPVFFGITLLVFTIERLAGDPVQLYAALNPRVTEQERELLRNSLHLDQPIQVQYLSWLSDLLHLNLGNSFSGGSVATLIAQRIWATLELQLLGLTLSLIIAIPIGITSARKRYSTLDVTITSTSLIGTSIPIFFLGVAAILIFGYNLHWFPSGGFQSTLPSQYPYGNLLLDLLWHLFLPVTIYTFAILAPVVLLVRSSMLEVLRQDYMLAAKASGLKDRTVTYKHGLRNALIPIVTYVGLYFGGLLAGAPVTETVFNWPGVGRMFVDYTTQLDFPVIQAIVVIITVMTLIANLITDVTYAYIDPRIRLE